MKYLTIICLLLYYATPSWALMCSNCSFTNLPVCSQNTTVSTLLTWPDHGEIWEDEKECQGGVGRIKCSALGVRDRTCDLNCRQSIQWGRPSICLGRTCSCANVTVCTKSFYGRGHNRVHVMPSLCSFGRIEATERKRDEFDRKKKGHYIMPNEKNIVVHRGDGDAVVHVTKNGNHSAAVLNNDLTTIVATGPGHYLIEVENSDGSKVTKELTIPDDGCHFDQDCWACWDLVGLPTCSKRTSTAALRYAVGGFGILMLALACCLLPWVVVILLWTMTIAVWLIKKAFCALKAIPRTKIARRAYSSGQKVAAVAADAFSTPPPVIVVIMLLPLVLACSSTVDSATVLTNCIDSGQSQVCGLNTIVTATFSGRGDTSCINIDANSSRFSIELTWINRTDVVDPEFQYYTSGYIGRSSSFVSCPGTSKCDINSSPEDPCAMVDPSDIRLSEVGFVDFFNNPGISMCTRDSANFGGCFYQTSTCRYKRCVLLPMEPSCAVFVNRDFRSIYFFSIKISDQNGLALSGEFQMQEIDDEITGTLRGLPFKIITKLNGQFAGEDSGLTRIGHTYMCNGVLRKMAGSDIGVPTKNKIGDIQSNEEIVSSGGNNAFAFDSSIISDDGVGCRFVQSALSAGTQAAISYPLPFIESGNTFTIRNSTSGHKLVADIRNSPPITIKLTITADVKIEQVISVVCPSGGNATISGCWNCPNDQPVATLTLKSDCAEGIASVIGTGASPPTVSLSRSPEEFKIRFTSQKADVDTELLIRGSGGQLRVPLKGTLASNDVNLGDLNNMTKNANETDISADIALAFDDVFAGLGDWKDYLTVVGIVLGAVILAVLLIWLTCFVYRQYSRAKALLRDQSQPLLPKGKKV